MEEFKIYFLGEDPKHDTKIRLLLVLFAILVLLIEFIRIDYFVMVIGIGMLIAAIGYKKLSPRHHLLLNDEGIWVKLYNYKRGILIFYYATKKINIRWEDIHSITVRSITVEITLKDGSMEEISLGGLLYKQVRSFKEKLQEFMQVKGIEATT